MSFILEALKKSAQERERGNIPTLKANHQTDHDLHFSRHPTEHTVKWIILSVIILLPALLFGAWYGRNVFFPTPDAKVNKSQSTTKEITHHQPEKEMRMLPLPVDSEPVSRQIHSPVKPTKQLKSEPVVTGVVDNNTPETTQENISHREKENRTDSISTETANNIPPLLKYLPENVRNNIPEIKFAGHAYSDNPTKRMIMINNKIVRERDVIAPKLQLEEITLNGIILNYDSTRFRLEMFE